MNELESEDAPSAAARPATVDDGGIGGHTYLPGTASLVQEIDSKLLAWMMVGRCVAIFTKNVMRTPLLHRKTIGCSEGWQNDDRLPQKCGSIW